MMLPALSMSSNQYVLRAARTPRTCAVCARPSTLVLLSETVPQDDFFYTCAVHLDDRGFATKLRGDTDKTRGEPLHSRYALHREFYAQRCRMFTLLDARRRAPQFPAVPR